MSALDRLAALADHLEPDLAYELRRLAAADSDARRVLAAEAKAERADDLAQEAVRQMRALERRYDEMLERTATIRHNACAECTARRSGSVS